jgi:hypothetical protein
MARRLPVLALVAATLLAALPASAFPGDTLWTKMYDGPGSGLDSPAALAMDPTLHRVYAVGTSAGNGTGPDIVTIAYDQYSGTRVWARRYDGPAHGSDQGVQIAYDAFSGGVVVTGSSESSPGTGSSDVVTISYSADGSRRWAHRFSVSSHSSDVPVDLVVESGSEFVLVGGTAHGGLVSYDYEGKQTWRGAVTTRTLASLVGLELIGGYLLAVGNTFMTTSDNAEYFTAGFNAHDGTALWSKRYSGPSHDGATATDAMAGGTSLFVTGTAIDGASEPITTIEYGPHDGFRYWRRTIPAQAPGNVDVAPRIAAVENGTFAAVAATSYLNGVPTFLTRGYHADGSTAWTTREDGPTDTGTVNDIAVGPDGSVAVAGSGTNVGDPVGPFTVAYDSTGNVRFEAAIAPSGAGDVAWCVMADDAGRVIVGARSAGDLRVDAYATS